MQQVGDGAERRERGCFTRCGGIEVRPRSRDERTRTVRQDEDQIELAVTPHPAEQWQRLAFQRVPRSDHSDCGRITLEMGSVMPFRSTLFRTSSFSERYDDTPTSDGFCCTWSVG